MDIRPTPDLGAPSRFALFSLSLGRAWNHRLVDKLDAAYTHGIQGLEIWFEDLVYHAHEMFAGDQPAQLLAAARSIAALCHERNIEVISLQPFANYEALKDRSEHAAMIEKAKLYIAIAHELRTDTILVPATYREPEALVDSLDLIVSDLAELADIGAQFGIRFAYEALCWSTLTDTWEGVYDIVRRVDRSNFGICLDTFNIAGRVFADPTATDGQNRNAWVAMQQSINCMISAIDVSKVFLIQVVDAERLEQPLLENHPYYSEEQPERMSWSRNCRLFYGERSYGAYLPVKQILTAIFKGLGYRGWVSMEFFNRSLNETGPAVPSEHAARAAVAWESIVRDFQLQSAGEPR